MKFSQLLLPVAILLSMTSVSCDRAVTQVTTTLAPWAYVEDAWGGIVLKKPVIDAGRVSLPFDFHAHAEKRIDSAICICGVSGRVEGERILLRIEKCLCGPGAGKDTVARFAKPKPGRYPVVYDDADAGFPKLGEVEIP